MKTKKNQFFENGTVLHHDASTWITHKEIRYLMRFHGTDAVKITEDAVFILRGNRWLPVLKRGEG